MQPSIAYHVFRVLWFIGGPAISCLMWFGAAGAAAMTRPYGSFTRHEKLSMDSLVLFSAIAALLGVLALIGTRHRWIRASGRLMLFVAAPILLGIHLNYTWASSGPVHHLDSSSVAGLVSSWMAAIALWEFNCRLGRRQATRLAGSAVECNRRAASSPHSESSAEVDPI